MNRFFKGAILAAAVAMVPLGAFAEGGPYATFEIKLDQSSKFTDLSPTLAAPITKDHVAFHIVNNTGKALFFNNNEGEYIPLVSNNTVTVPYQSGDEYKVVDADGNTVATWNLNGNKNRHVANVTSASQEQFAAWGSTLQQVIENQKVSYQEPPADPEPYYYGSRPAKQTASKTTTRKTIIRGYW